jgi:hypothetical protein
MTELQPYSTLELWDLFAPYQINSFMNHLLEKIHRSYQSEADKEVSFFKLSFYYLSNTCLTELQTCQVMAGFSKKQAYFVPRALLQLPHPIGWYKERLLPELTTWRQQAAHPTQGDKSQCAQKFLNQLIPYFLEVAVQDGIYFVRDFPNHPFTIRKKQNECGEEEKSVYFVLVFLIVSLILDEFEKEKYSLDKRSSATVSAQSANP